MVPPKTRTPHTEIASQELTARKTHSKFRTTATQIPMTGAIKINKETNQTKNDETQYINK